MSGNKVLYDNIGSGYNATRQADPYIAEKLFQLLFAQSGKLYMDLGCGTGNYTIALANKGLNFHGVEPSGKMLDIAKSRNSAITWHLGTAEQIPANDGQFDGAIATLTIHHWADLKESSQEIYRVLKNNTKLVIFTATPQQMKGYWLNHYFPKMLMDSILQMPGFNNIKEAAEEAGFIIANTEKYFIPDDLEDHFLYVGKNRPELYLDEEVRKGISSFSALANAGEVKQGLEELYSDIKHNRFQDIKEQYNNDLGDYLFITIQKN
jgi:SAM-dependent methyltransferase